MSHFEHGLLVFSAVTAALGVWLFGLSRVAPVVDSYWQRLPTPMQVAAWKGTESLGLTLWAAVIMCYGFWSNSAAHATDQSLQGFANFCWQNWWSILGATVLAPAYCARQGFKDAGVSKTSLTPP